MLTNAGFYLSGLYNKTVNFRTLKILVILFECANIVLLVIASAITIQQQTGPINILLNGTALAMISNLDETILESLELEVAVDLNLKKMLDEHEAKNKKAKESATTIKNIFKIGTLAVLSALFYILIDYSSYYRWHL